MGKYNIDRKQISTTTNSQKEKYAKLKYDHVEETNLNREAYNKFHGTSLSYGYYVAYLVRGLLQQPIPQITNPPKKQYLEKVS